MALINREMLRLCNSCVNKLMSLVLCRNYVQKTVLRDAVQDAFSPSKSQVFVDLTFGAGGHTRALINSAEDVKVYALDRDPEAHQVACKLASEYSKDQLVPLSGLFSDLPAYMIQNGIPPNSFDGILLETGPSWMQLENDMRGFNWEKEGPLDMRMDAHRNPELPTAADVINSLDSVPLSHILKKYGNEKHAKKISKALVDARYLGRPVETTRHLSELVTKVIGAEYCTDVEQRNIPACQKTFDSLRKFVNNEFNELNYALHVAYHYLKPGGKLVTITYGPLEDIIVKKHLMGVNMDNPRNDEVAPKFVNAAKWYTPEELGHLMPHKWKILHRKIEAKPEEIALNPRSNFAKLRVASKADLSQKRQREAITAQLHF